MKHPAQCLAQDKPSQEVVCVGKPGFVREPVGTAWGLVMGDFLSQVNKGAAEGFKNVMRLLFRKVIWAAVKVVQANEIWGQGISQDPWIPLFKFLNPELGNPLLHHFVSLGSLPMCCLPLLNQEAEEALKSSWEILQARREPSLARLHAQDWHGWIIAVGE